MQLDPTRDFSLFMHVALQHADAEIDNFLQRLKSM